MGKDASRLVLTSTLGKLDISSIDFNNSSQTLDRVFSHHSAISGIDYEHFLIRPELEDDPTNIRLTRKKGKSKSRLRCQPKSGVIGSHPHCELLR